MTNRGRDSGLPERQAQLLAILRDHETPQPASVLMRVMHYKHGVKASSVTYDTLGAMQRKGLVALGPGGWKAVG